MLDRLLHPRQPTVKKSRAALALMALSVLFALAGVTFLGSAVYIWLETQNGALSAALTMSAGLLTLALALAATGVFIKNRRKMRLRAMPREVQKDFPHNVPNVIESLVDELGDTIRDHPKAAMLAAIAAGFMAREKVN